MLLAASAATWRCHLGGMPWAWVMVSLLLALPGAQGPRVAPKSLDGPGVVPRVSPPTSSTSPLLKVKGTNQNLGLA